MSDFFEGKWKPVTIRPKDDSNILVSYKDCGGNYQGPYRAYYMESEDRFFSLDDNHSIPLQIEIWIEIPEFPK